MPDVASTHSTLKPVDVTTVIVQFVLLVIR